MYTLKENIQTKAKAKKPLYIKLLAAFYFIFVALILLSYIAPFVSPEYIWQLAFIGISYPILLIINILFGIFWLTKKSRLYIVSAIVILLGWPQLSSLFQLNIKHEKKIQPGSEFKLLSYNVRIFDHYNWTNQPGIRYKISNLIKSESPEIICLQDVLVDTLKRINSLKALSHASGAHHIHAILTKTISGSKKFGIATLSSFPIVANGIVPTSRQSNNICIYTDLKVNDDTIRVYNAHLQSIRFNAKEYQYMAELGNELKTGSIEDSKKIITRIKNAFILRAKQVSDIRKHIENCPHPVLLCGDFNDTPSSYTYYKMSKGLKDAFSERGFGTGKTYVGIFPSFRIDYILHNNNFSCIEFRKLNAVYSDHYPIIAKLSLH